MAKRDVTHLSYEIIGSAIKVHKVLGPGLLEGVYEKCLKHELEQKGYQVLQQAVVPICYDKMIIDSELRIDYTDNISKSYKPFVNEYFKSLPG